MSVVPSSSGAARHPVKVSIGIPVRNGGRGIALTIDSILAQDYTDLEVVICDNGSDDGTPELVQEYAQRDPRVKLFINETNIGQNPNFNRVFEKSTGEYFRWIGVDDTLEPSYVSKCVAVLDQHPEYVAVSSDTRFLDAAGNVLFEPYHGERTESTRPERRFARTLWFLLADYRYFDPMYNMVRRDMLAKTSQLRSVPWPDQMLAAQTSLLGRVFHVPECLSTRHREPSYYDHTRLEKLSAQWNPQRPRLSIAGSWATGLHMAELAWKAPLSPWQKLMCTGSVMVYITRRGVRDTAARLLRAARTVVPAEVRSRLRPPRATA